MATAQDRYQFTAQYPGPTIVRTEGCELITSTGQRIIDGAAGAVVNNIGHGRQEVVDAVAKAMSQCDYVLPTWTTPARLELADLLVEKWLPPVSTMCSWRAAEAKPTTPQFDWRAITT